MKFINDMSKFDKVFFQIIIYGVTISLFLLFSSCAVLRKEKTTDTTTIEKLDTTKKLIELVETSGAIKDRIVINVPETDNKELLRMFDSMMRQMNSSKTSGTNSYQSRYNEETRQWLIDFTMAQTQNSKSEKELEVISDKSFQQNVDEYIKKIVIPWWVYGLAMIFLWPYIEKAVTLFVPGFKIGNLFKK